MPLTGKIIKSVAGFYEVHTGEEIYRCRARGLFRALHEKPLVGDNVEMEITDEGSLPKEGNITRLLPRKNDLVRPNVANVDQALLLFAVKDPVPSFNMLDRFLITMHRKGLPAVLCFNKTDLASAEHLKELGDTYSRCGCQVLFLSVRSKREDLAKLKEILEGKTTVITGPSGAGKSSLINRLCPDANMQTGELSAKIARGKNTTRHVQLLSAGRNTYLVDTPGFTSLYLLDMEAEQLKDYYPEFEEYQPQCRFQGCCHMKEPDCRVKGAVREGKISRIRYENYREIFEQLKDTQGYR